MESVKTKLMQLRNEYTKAKKPQKSGSSRKGITKKTQLVLEKLQFLEPLVATRASTSSLEIVSNFFQGFIVLI